MLERSGYLSRILENNFFFFSSNPDFENYIWFFSTWINQISENREKLKNFQKQSKNRNRSKRWNLEKFPFHRKNLYFSISNFLVANYISCSFKFFWLKKYLKFPLHSRKKAQIFFLFQKNISWIRKKNSSQFWNQVQIFTIKLVRKMNISQRKLQ